MPPCLMAVLVHRFAVPVPSCKHLLKQFLSLTVMKVSILVLGLTLHITAICQLLAILLFTWPFFTFAVVCVALKRVCLTLGNWPIRKQKKELIPIYIEELSDYFKDLKQRKWRAKSSNMQFSKVVKTYLSLIYQFSKNKPSSKYIYFLHTKLSA